MSHYILSIALECEHDHPTNAIAAIQGTLPEGIKITERRHRQRMLISDSEGPLIVVEYKELMNPEHVLKWYAKEYDFPLDNLKFTRLPTTVHCELNDIQLREYA